MPFPGAIDNFLSSCGKEFERRISVALSEWRECLGTAKVYGYEGLLPYLIKSH